MTPSDVVKRRILFGGSFDPPTMAHRHLVEIALAARPNAELLVIPAGTAPHKRDKRTTPPEHRLAMARLAFEGLPRVRVSDEEIVRGGTSWTVDTLERHRREIGDHAQLFFLLGADSLLSFGKWRSPRRILELATILAVARPGFDFAKLDEVEDIEPDIKARLRAGILDATGPDLSSTELREVLQADGRPASREIDPRVLAYIDEHGLYRESKR